MKAKILNLWRRARRLLFQIALAKTYRMFELEGYATTNSIPNRVLAEGGRSKCKKPHFLRTEELCNIAGYEGTALSPEVRLFELNKVTVVGRTEFILKDNISFYPKIINPVTDVFMIELEKRGKVNLSARTVNIFPRLKTLRVDRAVSLLGQCNGNYAHWITEVLTRLILIDELPEFRHWPILVDCPVHERLLDSLDFLNIWRRPVISVKSYQKVDVGQLIYITPASMTPPETREFFEKGTLSQPRLEQFHFSQPALEKLRKKAVRIAMDFTSSPKWEDPWNEPPPSKYKRVFFDRAAHNTGNGRLLRNLDTVKAVLSEYGFSTIELSDLEFERQILAVQDIQIVVSPIGAALVNLVFREPGCIVVVMSPHYSGATFYYFANLMATLGHELIFVLGSQTRHGGATVYNRDYRVSGRLLRQGVLQAIQACQTGRSGVYVSFPVNETDLN